jgi:glycosyltransferase involved in cell wall biosynthesis
MENGDQIMPAVSICIPAYGRPAELGEAIDSVLTQNYRDLEVIVSDDSGELGEVVERRADKRLRYFCNPTNFGMARNWTASLDRATGEYIGLLMDDDRLLPGFLESVVPPLQDDSTLGITFSNHLFSNGRRVWQRDCRLVEGKYAEFLTLLLVHKPVAVSAALMRREVWEAIRPLPDLLTADLYMHLRVAESGWSFYYVDRPLMVYRVHQGQLSSNEVPFREDNVRLWNYFQFVDSEAEVLRRRHLAGALVQRAASRAKQGQLDKAREDVSQARRLKSSQGYRLWVLSTLLRWPKAINFSVRFWNLWSSDRAIEIYK